MVQPYCKTDLALCFKGNHAKTQFHRGHSETKLLSAYTRNCDNVGMTSQKSSENQTATRVTEDPIIIYCLSSSRIGLFAAASLDGWKVIVI